MKVFTITGKKLQPRHGNITNLTEYLIMWKQNSTLCLYLHCYFDYTNYQPNTVTLPIPLVLATVPFHYSFM